MVTVEGSMNLFCSTKFPWARERISSKFTDILGVRPQNFSPVTSSTKGLKRFYSKRPVLLLLAGSQAARANTTVSGVPTCLQCCVIVIVHTELRNVAADRKIKSGGPRVGDPCPRRIPTATILVFATNSVRTSCIVLWRYEGV
jgi:hypothetical protein